MKFAIQFTEGSVNLHSRTVFDEKIVDIIEKVEGVNAAFIQTRYKVVCFKGVLFEESEIVENIKAALSKAYENVEFEVLPVFTQKIDNRNGDAC